MNISVEGKVGPEVGNDGNETEFRLERDGSQRVQDAHGKYAAAAGRGKIYSLSTAVASITVAAGHIIGGGTPLVGIYNPTGSGKTVGINRVALSVNSGTPGAGGFVFGYMKAPNTTITTLSGNTEVNQGTFVIGGSGISTYVAVAVTGFVSALLRHIGGPAAGAVAANASHNVQEETGGSIMIPPGVAVGIFAALAGTSPIVNAGMEFEVFDFIY